MGRLGRFLLCISEQKVHVNIRQDFSHKEASEPACDGDQLTTPIRWKLTLSRREAGNSGPIPNVMNCPEGQEIEHGREKLIIRFERTADHDVELEDSEAGT